MNKIIASLATFFVASTTVLATDLTNKDSRRYEVKIQQGPGTTNASIDSNTTRIGVCSSACTVEVVGVGSVKLTGKEKAVIIEKGKMSVVN